MSATMMRPQAVPTLGWSNRVPSTGTPSPTCSPRSSNISLSPLSKQRLPVNFLINDDAESDGESWANTAGALSSPHHSRLSTPSDHGAEVRPEVRQKVSGVTLPGFDDIARLAGGLLPPPPVSPTSITKVSSPAAPAPWSNWHGSYHHRPHLPPPPLSLSPRRQVAPLADVLPCQKKQRKPPTNPTGLPRTNRKYTQEQIDFVLYLRVDRKMNWTEVIPAYMRQFPSEVGRTTPGLQGSFYRENLAIPVTDPNGDLMFDENGEQIVQVSKVRDQPKKIGLLDRYPDRALDYTWVEFKDKQRVWHRGSRHKAQIAAAKLRQQRRQAYA